MQFLKSWIEQLQQLIGAAEEGNISEVQRIIGEVNQDFPLRYLKDKVSFSHMTRHISVNHGIGRSERVALGSRIWTPRYSEGFSRPFRCPHRC